MHFFAPFERVEETTDATIVSGPCYTSPTVSSDEWTLPASVLRDATPEFMRFANLREMHGRSAAGTVAECVWNGDVCEVVARVVDPVAREKVRLGEGSRFQQFGIRPRIGQSPKLWRRVT